ncbi:hypothetical protein GC163_13715 [bacterium]|nr:hypothetical protein [bacterium]
MSSFAFAVPQLLNFVQILLVAVGFIALSVRLKPRKPRTARIALGIGLGELANLVMMFLFQLAMQTRLIMFPMGEDPLSLQMVSYIVLVWMMSLPSCLVWLLTAYAILEQPDQPVMPRH